MNEPAYDRPLWQLAGLLAAFVALVLIGVFTVIIPELQDDPEDEQPAQSAEPAEASPQPATPDAPPAPAPAPSPVAPPAPSGI